LENINLRNLDEGHKDEVMKAIAHDYYFSPLSIKKIAEKHRVYKAAIHYAINLFPIEFFSKKPVSDIDRVLVINESDMDRVEALLKEANINYDLPFKFTLNIEYESSMNKKQ
jgi:hypothetical protein